ncbi:hypothetical protein [Longimicrobium sp.]|uniref:hypothetical protein n=1 Tax=Longimicrobium sp. TaxID=2029185 RepID=UPI002D801FCC|nr:hypothetical protein [Longimicrobium sp.]
MRFTGILAAAVLALPLVLACGPNAPATDQAPVVTAFQEGTSPGAQARHAQEQKARADLEQCRKLREQGVYARERRFPCEGFLGE